MHRKCTAHIDTLSAGTGTPREPRGSHAAPTLVLEQLPSGEFAWLWPRRQQTYVPPSRFWLTDRGRRALALEALFGPWPTITEASTGVVA